MAASERQLGETLRNRSGIMTSPELSRELIEGAAKATPSMKGDSQALATERAEVIKEANPIGSLPETRADAAGQAIFLDKLGERLVFERQGSRLYEAMIGKCELLSSVATTSPPLEELEQIHQEEKQHFSMLQKVIADLGGDSTVQTPSADVSSILSTGPMQILADPRTNMSQCLQAILTAELADNEGWRLLKELASGLERDDLAEQFEHALDEEEEHLEKVRFWLLGMTLEDAQVEFEVSEEELGEEEEIELESAPKQRQDTRSRAKKPGSKSRKKKK